MFDTAEETELWAAVTSVYGSFLAGDRAAVDGVIAADATVWDAFEERLARGRDELDALRDARPSDEPSPVELRAIEPVIDIYGDIGVVRHLLVVRYDADSGIDEQHVRNTSVWQRRGGRWQCIHNHEDLLGG
jgi:ketosteroid isomerase-like protein